MEPPPDPLPEKERCFLPPRVEILRLDFSRIHRPAPAQVTPDQEAGIGPVVMRLLAIVREHRASARRVGSPLEERDLEAVFEALRIESYGGDPRPFLRHSDPVAAWLRRALFDDLLEVARNLTSSDLWRGSLDVLTEKVTEVGSGQ